MEGRVMPIRSYVFRGGKVEVLEKADQAEAFFIGQIDPDAVVAGDTKQFMKYRQNDPGAAIVREATAPGGFQGLPTKRFYR